MNRFKLPALLLVFSLFVFAPFAGSAQITSNDGMVSGITYSNGNKDSVYVFCGNKGELNASLTANMPAGESGTFEWQKYNLQSGIFELFSGDLSGSTSSTISNLENGCYRVKISAVSGEKIYTAWSFNNYIEAAAELPESDCNSITLNGTFDSPALTYIDLPTGQARELVKDIQVKWSEGNVVVSRVISPKIFNPPTKDTDYTLEVSDRFGCKAEATVRYISIVTKALFSVSVDKGEAPLEVTFTNQSENGDPGKFEWFIFRDLDEIKADAEKNPGAVIDSIMEKLYNESPVYTFENSGSFKVKLVSKKVSELYTCYDTVYLDGYIVADTSFVDAPNVFTPNGDGTNDEFIVKFWSMKEIKISIFNRWGKLLHVWESNNIINYGNTIDTVPQAVWDGKIGGKYASPGVYYYVVDGIGRDGRRRKANGFFHLFRGK